MLAYVPRFSKYIHACACLHVDAVSELPYWFLPNGDGSLSPASWEEMADNPVVCSLRHGSSYGMEACTCQGACPGRHTEHARAAGQSHAPARLLQLHSRA